MTTALFLTLFLIPAADKPGQLVPVIPAIARPTHYPGNYFDLSADGKTIVSSFQMNGFLQFLRLRDLETGVILHDLPLGTFPYVRSLKFAPDGKSIAVSVGPVRNAHIVRVIQVSEGKLIREFTAFDDVVEVRGFSADSTQLITLDYAHSGTKPRAKPRIDTWEIATGKRLSSVDAKIGVQDEIATPDGTVRVARKPRNSVVVTRTNGESVTLDTEDQSYINLLITPDGSRVVLTHGNTASVFDTKTGKRTRKIRDDSPVIASIATANDGKLLFVATNSNPHMNGERTLSWVSIWDMSKPELVTIIAGMGNELWKVQPTSDGKRFVVLNGSEWGATKIEVWDTATKKVLHKFDVAPTRQGRAAVSADGNWISYASQEQEKPVLRVWNSETGKLAEELTKAAAGAQGTLAFTTDSKRLIAVSPNAYTEWDIATGKKEVNWSRGKDDARANDLRNGYANHVAALPGSKGTVVVSATAKRRQSYIVELVTEKKRWPLGEFWDYASAPVVSADGRTIAIVAGHPHDGRNVLVLKLNADGTPESKPKPERHYGHVFEDGTVPDWKMWDVRESGGVVSFTPDGQRVFTGGLDNAVGIWDMESHKLKATIYLVPPALPTGTPTDWVIFTPAGHFVGSPTGEKSLRFKHGSAATWFGWPSDVNTPAADMPNLRDPAKVRAAFEGK